MRVCLLSARFPPQLCGNGDYTYFLGSTLAQMGYEVDVLTSVGELDPVLYPLPAKLRVHRVVKSWGLRWLPYIIRVLRTLHPDVLVIQYTPHAFHPKGITCAVNLLPLLLRAMTRTRVVTNFHELYIPFNRSVKHWVGTLWQRAMAFVMAAGSHVLTAISSEWPRYLRRIGVSKPIQVIPVGSNIPRAELSEEERELVRDKLLDASDSLLVGGFGSLGTDRDFALLADGLQRLKREQRVKLIWLGASGLQGEKWVRIQAELQARDLSVDLVCTGPLPHPEISRIMAACDLFVLPFTDGVSTKRGTVAAALLHGLPLLTTRGEQVDPFFVHGENVYLVPIADGQALGDGLLELAQQPDLRARLAQGALVLYDTHFSWDLIAYEVVRGAVEKAKFVRLPWNWGSKVTEQLLWDGLARVKDLFCRDVLDLGCGMKPYQSLLGCLVRRWVGLDLEITPSGRSEANVFGSALAVPFRECVFDTVLSTQILEHVPSPSDLFCEAYRVLKPGGYLVLTAPQTNPLHEEPHDYFRYTCYSLRLLAEQAGFHIVEIKPLGGAIATVGQVFIWHLNWLRRVPLLGPAMSSWVNASLAGIILALDRLSTIYGGGAMKDTLNWLLVARKPERC